MNRLFGFLFIFTGLFAIVGGLCTWGTGNIFFQKELIDVLIPWADIIFTGPLSIVCGYGILMKQNWGKILGMCTSGIYVFGSILVFISIVWNNNYSICLIAPASTGFLIGLVYVVMALSPLSLKQTEMEFTINEI
jgi:hypothetical protein